MWATGCNEWLSHVPLQAGHGHLLILPVAVMLPSSCTPAGGQSVQLRLTYQKDAALLLASNFVSAAKVPAARRRLAAALAIDGANTTTVVSGEQKQRCPLCQADAMQPAIHNLIWYFHTGWLNITSSLTGSQLDTGSTAMNITLPLNDDYVAGNVS